MAAKVNVFWPSGVFFSAGESGKGWGVLAMQFSLVLWPVAIRQARDFSEAKGVQALLDEFSQAHHTPDKLPFKRFRGHNTGG